MSLDLNNYNAFSRMIHRLNKDQKIPYSLLLLADETVEAIDKYIHQSKIYVLEQEEEIIAVYAMQEISMDVVEIKNIAVETAFQGKGIGKKLLEHAIVKAKEQGYKKIIIGTANGGIKQLYLYQKVGFDIFDIKYGFILENYPEPIYEDGIQLKHMIMLEKNLE